MDITEVEENLFAATDAKVLGVQCLDWIQITGTKPFGQRSLNVFIFFFRFLMSVDRVPSTLFVNWPWWLEFGVGFQMK